MTCFPAKLRNTVRKTNNPLRLTGLSRLFCVAMMLGASLSAFAVSDAEMDQARAIAAKWYLRYINNGSDYLDNINPTSMSDLEGQLKKAEQENIKKFKAAPTPANYASWNKEDLVNYWGVTFFKESKALDPKGQNNDWIKSKVTNAVKNNVKVAAVTAPVAEISAAGPAAEPNTVVVEEVAVVETPEAAETNLASENLSKQADQATEPAAPAEKKRSSGTWVYVMILCILVAVVIALAVYASKTMKSQNAQGSARQGDGRADGDDAYAPRAEERRAPLADDTRMREKFAETLAAKSEEIRNLNRKISELEALNASLTEENRRLKAESAPSPGRRPAEEREATRPRSIYLGRANARGLFVRADRHAVEGQSIYRLSTADGITGTYTIIDNPIVEEQILADPGKWAAGGCVAKDIFDTEGRERVVMETPGTAVFEDGAWRVDRKARIRYE